MGTVPPDDSPAGRKSQVSPTLDQSESGQKGGDLPTLDDPLARVVRAPGMKDDHLRIGAVGRVSEGVQPRVLVLVDTGAQISLVRKGLISPDEFQPMTSPIRLLTASKQPLRGGDRQVKLDLVFEGVCEDTGEPVQVVAPTLLCEADIADDVIVSYTWLGERGFEVSPRRHGIFCQVGTLRIWVPGLQSTVGADPPVVPIQVRQTSVQKKMALDLFSGTGSATRVLQSHGYHVVSVDSDPKWDPSVCVDVMTWEYAAAYPAGAFDIIVAAPPVHRVQPCAYHQTQVP